MTDTVRNLVYKVQSDFSDANKGLDSFSENMDKLTDKADEVGRKIASQFEKSLAGIKLPELTNALKDMFPATNSTFFASMTTQAVNVVKALVDIKAGIVNAQNEGVKFDTGIVSAMNNVIKEAANVAKAYDNIKQAQTKASANQDPNQTAGLNKNIENLKKQAADAVDILEAGIDKLANRKDIQLNFGGDAVKQQLADVGVELKNTQSYTTSLNAGLKEIAENPFFKGTVSNQVRQMGDELKIVTAEEAKLASIGKQVADVMASMKANPGGIGSGEQYAKAADLLKAYKEQADLVQGAQANLNKTLGETQGIDKFMASLGAGTLDKAQGLLKDTSKAVFDLVMNLAKANDVQGFNKVIDELPRFSDGMKVMEDNLRLIPELIENVRKGGVGGAHDLQQAFVEVVFTQKEIEREFGNMANSTQVLQSSGITDLRDQLKAVEPAIAGLKEGMAGLIEEQSRLASNPLTKIFNPEGIKQTSDGVLTLNKELDKTVAEAAKAGEALAKMSGSTSGADITKMGDNISKLNEKIASLKSGMASMGQVQSTTSSFSGLNEIMGDMGIKTALLATGFFGWFSVIQTGISTVKELVSAGIDWETQLTNLKVGTDISAQGINKVSDAAKSLSANTGASLDGIIGGFKTAAQEGFNVADSMKVVDQATKAAVATGSDETKIVSDLSRVMENYRISADGAAGVSNVLFQGAKSGAVPLEQFADGMTKVSATAGSLKISLPEASAALSTLDKALGGTQNNGQGLALMFDRMNANISKTQEFVSGINPELAKMFTPEILHGPEGFTKVLEALNQVARTNPEVMGKMFGSFNAGGQAIVINGNNLSSYKEALEKAKEAQNSTSETTDALNQRLDTAAGQWTKFKANMGVAAVDIGSVVVPAIRDVLKLLNDLAAATGKAYNIAVNIVTTINDTKGGQIVKGILETIIPIQAFEASSDYADKVQKKVNDEFHKILTGAKNGLDRNFMTNDNGSPNPIREWMNNFFDPTDDAKEKNVQKKMQEAIDRYTADTKANVAKAGDGMGDAASTADQNAQDVAAKIATSISTIAKGIEDSMKLLAEARNIKIPDNIEELIRPLATAIKKIYDTFANVVGNENNSTQLQKIAEAISSEIKSVKDMAELFKALPGLTVTDPSGNIDKLVQAVMNTSKSFNKLVSESGIDMGAAAAGGEIAKSINEEITVVKNMAELYKNVPDANSIPAFAESIKSLVQGTVGLVKDFQELHDDQQTVLANAIPINENVIKLVDVVKNMAELYKTLPTVTMDPSFPQTIKDLAGETAALVQNFSELTFEQKTALDTATPISDNVSKMVTVLKDVAELYKQLGAQDTTQIVDVSKITEQLAKTAATIAVQVEAALPPSVKAATSAGQVAEGVSKMVTLLKDVAELFKAAGEVDFTQDYTGPIKTLSASVSVVANSLLPTLNQYNTKVETELGTTAEGIGKQVNLLKDIAELYKTAGEVDFSQDYTKPITQLSNSIGTVADNTLPQLSRYNEKAETGLGVVAEGIGKQVNLLKDIAELFKAAGEVDFSEDYSGPIKSLGQSISIIANTTLPELSQYNAKAETQLGVVAEGIGKQVNLLKDVAGLLKDASSVDISNDYSDVVAKLVEVMLLVTKQVESVLGSSAGNKDLSRLSDMAAKEVKAITDTVKLIGDLQNLPTIDMGRISDQIVQIVNILLDTLDFFDKQIMNTVHSQKADQIATDAANVFKPIADAVKVINDLQSMPTVDTGKMEAGIDNVIQVITGTLKYFDDHLIKIKDSGQMNQIANDAAAVMKAVGDTVKVINDLLFMPKVSDDKLKAAIDLTIKTMMNALVYFEQQVKNAKMQSDPLTAKIGAEIGTVMDAIDKTLKVFTTLGSKQHMVMNASSIKEAVDGAIGTTKYFIKALTESGIDEGQIAQASKAADEIGKVIDTLTKLEGKTTINSHSSGKSAGSSVSHSGGFSAQGLQQLLGQFGQGGGSEDDSPPTPGIHVPGPNVKLGPAYVPDPWANYGGPNAPTPNNPSSPAVGQTKDDGQVTLNTEIHLDSEVIAKAMGQKMFRGQTMRQNLVPNK